MKKKNFLCAVLALGGLCACENLMDELPMTLPSEPRRESSPDWEETARLLSRLPLGDAQMEEVHHAVSASRSNGFDEEYLLADLFAAPGSGVGDRQLENEAGQSGAQQSGAAVPWRATESGAPTLRDLIRQELSREGGTKAFSDGASTKSPEEEVEAIIERLCSGGVQIYWPYSEDWDGESLPVITFDPGSGPDANYGWRLYRDARGQLQTEEVRVDEQMALGGNVWVVNGNEDSGLSPLAFIRKTDPDWGGWNHGTIGTEPSGTGRMKAGLAENTKATKKSKTLVLKKFMAKRNFDSWFAGGSEFFIKIGKVEDFKGTTEKDLLLYKPSITDFMISVPRKDVGKEIDFNALLVSEWTDQLSMCAFLITEDDGGTITKWDCTAVVKINSKSYGVEMSIPINSKDDIVWRGQLSGKYINATANLTGHFGDVDLVFEVVEY
ncbi:MAG: hypothetical protein J6Y32_08290 [Bacteroidales bacterium]|nr:hypothetical protein [Bacteroidales bacterium]